MPAQAQAPAYRHRGTTLQALKNRCNAAGRGLHRQRAFEIGPACQSHRHGIVRKTSGASASGLIFRRDQESKGVDICGASARNIAWKAYGGNLGLLAFFQLRVGKRRVIVRHQGGEQGCRETGSE